jgi:hypothetical protein
MPKRAAGCFECRKRKVWCDDTRPQCNNCMRRGTKCPGYRPTQAFLLHNFDASLDILHKSSNRKAYDVLSRLPLHEEDYASPLKRINSKIYPPAPILVDGMYPGLGPMLDIGFPAIAMQLLNGICIIKTSSRLLEMKQSGCIVL